MAGIWKYSRIVWAGLIGVVGAALGAYARFGVYWPAKPQVEPIAKESSPGRALLSGEADAKVCRSQWEAEAVVINIYIDNNIWDFLFARQIDLADALPSNRFCLYIPREVEFEVRAIPTVLPEKAELKAFIEATIAKCDIRTDTLFGFNDDSLPPDEQRVGGFDRGRWASSEEMAFRAQQALNTARKKRPSKLHPDEADISLAACAFHSVVLSLDDKPGPIRDASAQGGKVVFLTGFVNSGLSLSDFILKELGRAQ
jgi:hypothetical protein